jgi:hypothetical protein
MPGSRFAGPSCGATAKSTGLPCRQPAMPNGRCRLHGGLTPVGIASPNFKHGRYSDFAPEKLLQGYARQVRDPELLQQRDEIALLDSMIFEALKRMSDADSPAAWLQLRRLWRSMQHANDAGDMSSAAAKMETIGELIRRGASDFDQREDVLYLIERKRRVIESQSKREVQERLTITYEEAALVFEQLAQVVRDAVRHDPAARAAIGRGWAAITGSVPYLSEN